ncbi:MAG: aspartyl protease family protein [Chitinophagaceae bacterium]
MPRKFNLFFCFALLVAGNVLGQEVSIRSKEGRPILDKKAFILNCLLSFHKDRSDKTALSICECQASKMDGHFTNKAFRDFTASRVIDLSGLIKKDSLFQKQIQECYTGSGKTILLQAEGFESEFIIDCKESIQKSTEKKLDASKLTDFCNCQLEMVKNKKLTDAQIGTLSNPNSLLFYEIMANCGSPYLEKENTGENWSGKMEQDVNGPVSDTLRVLALNGMTYVKIRTGSLTQIWLLDTGASDLLINEEMETILRGENIISTSNYLGIGQYEMANGMIDTCRKYIVNDVKVGKYSLNNIVIAITTKGKRIIAGKALLNKFGSWILDNKNNSLILNK